MCKDYSHTPKKLKLKSNSPLHCRMRRDRGCKQTCYYGSSSYHPCSAHCKVPLACMPWLDFTASFICQHNCIRSHSLTQFCQTDLVNLNAFNSKVFFKPNHFDRAGLGHCSCYSSTKSNFNLRGSCPHPAPATRQLHVSSNSSPFPFLSSLQFTIPADVLFVSQISEMWV